MRSILLILACVRIFAALPNNTTWEVRNGGNDSNGGGFVSGASGTDFSQQATAQYTFTDLASSNGTTNPCVVSSASHSFVASDVGNIMQITAGTSWTTGFYEIVSVASNNATLDRACASAASVSAGTYAVGGALKTLSKMDTALKTTSNINQVAWVKADSTYAVSAGVTIDPTASSSNTFIQINGYSSTRGDNGQPTIQASSTSFTILQISNNNNLTNLTLRNFIIDCNSKASCTGFDMRANGNTAENILVENAPGSFGISIGTQAGTQADICRNCVVKNQTGGVAIQIGSSSNSAFGFCIWCTASGNTVTGFEIHTGWCLRCISANNSGASSDGFLLVSGQGEQWIANSDGYNNGRDGIRFAGTFTNPVVLFNNILVNNAGWGINQTSTTVPSGGILENYDAFYNNTSGAATGLTQGSADVTLTANPFVNGASNNFALTGTASSLVPGFPGALQLGGTGGLSMGALQPTGSGGGQKGFPIVQ